MRRYWSPLRDERIYLYSPIGLRLVDDFTGNGPIGKVRSTLQMRRGGDWVNTGAVANIANGVVTYPGLGRSSNPRGQGPRRFRVMLHSKMYKPIYEADSDGIEFDVHAYNDAVPPQNILTHPRDALLLPTSSYPFPTYTRVLRGRVLNGGGRPLLNITVREGQRERVLSERNGSFSLPIRRPDLNAAVNIEAIDQRTGRRTLTQVQLPDALASNHDITIN